jgi:hypothetical protein
MRIETVIAQAGARLAPQSSSWRVRAWAQLSKLGGVNDFAESYWLTLLPVVYHPDGVNPLDPKWHTTIRHELRHIIRQREVGLTRWLWRYLTSQRFRVGEELDAYLEDVRAGVDPMAIAELLASAYRIDCMTVDEMAAWLRARAGTVVVVK